MRRRALVRAATATAFLGLTGSCAPALTSRATSPRRIGYLSWNFALDPRENTNLGIVIATLPDLGFVEGRDFEVVYRAAEMQDDRAASFARELVGLPVELLMAEASNAAIAAKNATTTIPIVFLVVNDPVGQGIVASLPRPGGNVTGVTTMSGAVSGKRLEMLKEALPGVSRIAVLWNAANPGQAQVIDVTQKEALMLGLATQTYGINTDASLDAALAAIAERTPDALVVLPNLQNHRKKLLSFALERRLPQMFSMQDDVVNGGLMAMSPDYEAQTQRAAALAGKILRGARPADLPVEQPARFLFTLNLEAARTLGLTIPTSVVRHATRVIQ